MEVPGRMQFTLVAFYGPKPQTFSRFLRSCQDKLANLLRSSFHPYDIEQIHATLVGLEGIREGELILNQNFAEHRGQRLNMDFGDILRLLRSSPFLPVEIQIGGFKPYEDYAFTSRGQHPHLRTFTIQGQTAVVMGWPVSTRREPAPLDRLRQSFQTVNVLHKFHKCSEDIDNDFFFVIGRVDRSPQENEFDIQEAEYVLRAHLADLHPLSVQMGLAQLLVVGYLDKQLPLATSCWFKVDDLQDDQALSRIALLYSEPEA